MSAPLAVAQFAWEWRDLTTVAPGLAVGRAAVEGRSAGRAFVAGEPLRQADLRDTPLVRAGDTVDLAVQRGSVVVTVRATARQDGVLGQIVTVRNDINGKLATGRVSGPGLVEWRR
jgi:flagella basal body P-ring formation protein FlgA